MGSSLIATTVGLVVALSQVPSVIADDFRSGDWLVVELGDDWVSTVTQESAFGVALHTDCEMGTPIVTLTIERLWAPDILSHRNTATLDFAFDHPLHSGPDLSVSAEGKDESGFPLTFIARGAEALTVIKAASKSEMGIEVGVRLTPQATEIFGFARFSADGSTGALRPVVAMCG